MNWATNSSRSDQPGLKTQNPATKYLFRNGQVISSVLAPFNTNRYSLANGRFTVGVGRKLVASCRSRAGHLWVRASARYSNGQDASRRVSQRGGEASFKATSVFRPVCHSTTTLHLEWRVQWSRLQPPPQSTRNSKST